MCRFARRSSSPRTRRCRQQSRRRGVRRQACGRRKRPPRAVAVDLQPPVRPDRLSVRLFRAERHLSRQPLLRPDHQGSDRLVTARGVASARARAASAGCPAACRRDCLADLRDRSIAGRRGERRGLSPRLTLALRSHHVSPGCTHGEGSRQRSRPMRQASTSTTRRSSRCSTWRASPRTTAANPTDARSRVLVRRRSRTERFSAAGIVAAATASAGGAAPTARSLNRSGQSARAQHAVRGAGFASPPETMSAIGSRTSGAALRRR